MIYTFIINLYKYMIKVEDDFAMEISARPQTMKKSKQCFDKADT